MYPFLLLLLLHFFQDNMLNDSILHLVDLLPGAVEPVVELLVDGLQPDQLFLQLGLFPCRTGPIFLAGLGVQLPHPVHVGVGSFPTLSTALWRNG